MYNDLIKKIKEYDTIVLARHIGVDPDALCSQLALRDSILLTYPKKKVYAIGTGSSRFLNIGKLDKLEPVENALFIVLDTPDQRRVDSVDFYKCAYSIKIDHHPFVEKFCDIEIIEDDKSSTCEILMNIIDQTELQCNESIAELLYMGLVSDSYRFMFNSCTSKTFGMVAKYMEKYNINLSRVYDILYTRPLSEVRLKGYIGTNLTITPNNLGYVIISDEILNQFGVDSASPGNMINEFNYIKDILVWATITEDKKNKQYRVSIRSRGPEINMVAEKHNGGGHKFASGAKVKTLEEAEELISDLDRQLAIYNSKE